MTAHVSPDAPRPPSGIRDSGGPMPFNEADFTRTAAELVAEGDRGPVQRAYAGTVEQADILRVLSEHRRECADNEWCAECLCGWLVPEDAEDFTAAHLAHVADVLARVDA